MGFRSVDVGGLGEHPVCHCRVSLSFSFGFLGKRTGRTSGPIVTRYNASYDVILGKGAPLGDCVDICVRRVGCSVVLSCNLRIFLEL